MLDSAQVEQLNRDCFCFPLDTIGLKTAIGKSQPDLKSLLDTQRTLFANSGVLLAAEEVDAMLDVVTAFESLVSLPNYRKEKMTPVPDLGSYRFGDGLLMGYDFHLGSNGPALIEVNTNAGGAFIVNEMTKQCRHVLPECCDFQSPAHDQHQLKSLLLSEWHSAGRQGVPRCAAIVDNQPLAQYLYPDMLIAKNYFEQCGIETVIADVSSLKYDQNELTCEGRRIDIVYNRSTDFPMTGADHDALRQAALADAVLVGPNPVHHALYADKRIFPDLINQDKLESYGLNKKHRATLQKHVPKTWLITQDNATEMYAQRRSLFFKPADGFGSKAVYRGDKITRRVWNDILRAVEQGQQYITQQVVPPSLRAIVTEGERRQLKFDVRIYTVGGEAVMAAARVYQGQTTNFRTAGGGFAPVYYIPQSVWAAQKGCRVDSSCNG